MSKNRILGMILVGTLLAGTLAACTPAVEQQPTTPQADTTAPVQAETTPPTGADTTVPPAQVSRGLVIATQNEPPSVAPARHVALAGGFMNALTHNGLFKMNYSDLEPIPDLITDWTAVSDTVFEFTLREGVMFHNGEEMTAYDVVASMFYVRTYPEARAQHGSIVDAYVIDRYTFRLDTGEPNAALFVDLTNQANFIMPASLIEAGHDFTTDPVGSGPFVFDEWRAGDFLNFVRFDNYFDTDRAPQLEYITWRIIPEGSSRTIALEAGEVDYIVEVAFPDIPRMQADPNIYVQIIPGTAFNFLLLNNDLPYFENVYVRRAIDMAIDKEAAVLASIDGFGIPIWENVPTVFAGTSSEGIRGFDPDGARALLAEHGIDPSNISFAMLASNEEARRRGEVVQANLADIGIETTIEMVDLATYLNVTQFGYYEAGFGGFIASNLIQFLRGTSHINSIDAQNRSRMYNRELSDLVDQAIATIDTDARLAILEEASRAANEHVGFIPMHLGKVIRAFNSNLVVPELSATGSMHLNMAYWAE